MEGIAYFKKIPEVLLSCHEEISAFLVGFNPFLGRSTKRERGRENPGTRPYNIIDLTKKKSF